MVIVMNNKYPIVLTIHNMDDIELLKHNSTTEYINIDLDYPNKEIINYFKENGQKYYYADFVNSQNGYIYVDYNTFIKGEEIIDTIMCAKPDNLNKLETCKYLYKSVGRIISYDINTISTKNELFNYNNLNTINNIWGALTNLKGTNISYTKIFYYLCRILDINNEIIYTSEHGHLANKIELDDTTFITDITKDIPFIQAKFQTKYFGNYNDDIDLDKKIKYIKDTYNDILLANKLKKFNFNKENLLANILNIIENIININDMGPIELGTILDIIFQKYCPSNHIVINNLYTIDIHNNQEHFILISDQENYYSYNYRMNKFLKIPAIDLERNIENKKIGIYLNEIIPNLNLNTNKSYI